MVMPQFRSCAKVLLVTIRILVLQQSATGSIAVRTDRI
jgi:hypothetical protein